MWVNVGIFRGNNAVVETIYLYFPKF